MPQSQPAPGPRASRPVRRGHQLALLGSVTLAVLTALIVLVSAAAGTAVSAAGDSRAPGEPLAGIPPRADSVLGADIPRSDTRRSDASVELGLRFATRVDGVIAALRVYRPAGASGPQSASLWTEAGTRIARVTMPASTEAGWVVAALRTPIRVERGEVYVASYHADDGYVADPNYFRTWDRAPGLVHPALVSTSVGTAVDPRNGVFRYGDGTSFPSQSHRSTNYWVDVAFVSTAAAPTTSTSPTTTSPTVTGPPTTSPTITCKVECPPCPSTCIPGPTTTTITTSRPPATTTQSP